ncbi:hypothetical protein E0H75_22275 [Kribbella capetownensis]|uniref:Uncharacterized protein n=1 Tax=Kribbella capetownensis TaxID=1572659 RepID=A0A4R0JMA5_9ACTN|nr:hypothetical protein [Kribbella capetownensis]TCC47507.1 hypothetical protein E0H75_22275 [Kribbella capetownensis]
MTAYTFLPWLRRGIAGGVDPPTTDARAGITVDLTVTGEAVRDAERPAVAEIHRRVQLYGPGDVVGIDRRAIVRVEPRDRTTNAESNYLPFVEFYDEDFPWRYSPRNADDFGRLAPWLALVVLADDEFVDGGRLPEGPLPFILVPDFAVLPPPEQLAPWAHVHVNRSLTGDEVTDDDMTAVLPRLQAVLDENPDLASSRLLCPRRLQPNRAYHAFLVPAYESGRLAGLGLDPELTLSTLHSSWVQYDGRPVADRLCYYHRWYFRTSGTGDFEQLVRLLRPRTVDARVGNRDLDVQAPGAELPGITELGGVLRLGGALKVPDTALTDEQQAEGQQYEDWDQPGPHPFQQALATFINLAETYQDQAPNADPVITPPLYGRWHALTGRLRTDVDDWVHELNLDPRFRVAAGLGAEVVRARQEEFMRAAWDQLGEVLEANRRIRAAQLAREVGYVFHSAHLTPLATTAPGRALAVTAPLHARLVDGGVTVAHRVAQSRIAAAPLSPAMRRVTRPRSKLMRALPFTADRPTRDLVPRINLGEVAAAFPRTAPTGTVTVERLEAALGPNLASTPRRRGVEDPVSTLPTSENFRIMRPDVIEQGEPPRPGAFDSPVARRFKTGLSDAYAAFIEADEVSQAPEPEGVQLAALNTATLAALHPDLTVPRRVVHALAVPERFRPLVVADFSEAMAYPVIDLPMYRPLVALSGEFFLPNLNLIPPDSITLLETNQRFTEAYLVGANHEMARELLWREYPTDQRGTPFRQFWDPSTTLPRANETPDQTRERLRDIPSIDRWPPGSALGSHDHRAVGDELVLVIRGELLKRYPTAVIYAHRAEWLPSGVRRPVELPEGVDPPSAMVRPPLYEAKVDPDVYFLGFALSEEEARGGRTPADDPGWFFVIKERPGEPRFGLDVRRTGPLQVWNDLAWPDVLREGFEHIDFDRTGTRTLVAPPVTSEKHTQHLEDVALTWHARMNADAVAYIMYQAPVLVAVHAGEMLCEQPEP